MDFYSQAVEIKDEIVFHRRFLHKNAESGNFVPKGMEYIANTLKNYGIPSQLCGNGITATVGSGNPVILLRADVDALPMEEKSGESLASTTKAAHTCGHDVHAAMLLGAAKLLKQQEKHLNGTVKFMFQPGEEILAGCKNMLENGLLQNPVPSAALALHTAAGNMIPGTFMYNGGDVMMLSADNFTITIKGRGGHGAYPQLTADPVNAGVHIYSALQSLVCCEVSADKMCVVSVGSFHAGDSGNIIPDSAVMQGAVRTDDEATRRFVTKRMGEIVQLAARCFGCTAELVMTSSAPALVCDEKLTQDIVGYIETLPLPSKNFVSDIKAAASEDFAYVAQMRPSAYIYLSAGFDDERGNFTAHNPKVRFNENVLPVGAAVYAHCAANWLKDNFGK